MNKMMSANDVPMEAIKSSSNNNLKNKYDDSNHLDNYIKSISPFANIDLRRDRSVSVGGPNFLPSFNDHK